MLVNFSGELSQLRLLPNRPESELFSNIAVNAAKGLPEIAKADDATDVPAVLVGGGPSLTATLESIRSMKERGAKVFALNNAAKFLVEHGIKPDYQVMIDSRELNVEFVSEKWAEEALLSSQCSPKVIEKCLEIGYPLRIWHPAVPEIDKHVGREKPFAIWSGWTVGLTALSVAHTLGHRELHLFGYDSCHSEEKSHAYSQPANVNDDMTQVAVDGKVFNCSIVMAAQAFHFEEVALMLAEHGASISVHGDGLIPYIARRMTAEQKVLVAVYDLGSSPPTYDFLSFLVEAEKERIKEGFDVLDVIFQPGPIGGFRHDNLPPSVEEREGMLHRICVSACRLLPSVRNVAIMKKRIDVPGYVFPKEWAPDNAVAHYGTRHFKDALRCLTATKSAKNAIARKYRKPYATITLRESTYWPTRNSNMAAWLRASDELERHGITAIFVPDYEGKDVPGHINCREATVDVDMRLALYEGAVLNLGVSNGPMALCLVSEVPYRIFRPIDPKAPATSKEFLAGHGMNEGDQYGPNGKLIWEDDTEPFVLRELEDFLYMNHFMEKQRACV